MEPLPQPGKLPGHSEPITDRSRQRLNRYMTTLIFRNYPAQAKRFMAERLQQEGWYDEEPWDTSDWFERARDPQIAGKEVKVGGGTKWSEDAWRHAYLAWKKHGEDNHLIFPSAADEANTRDLAARFAKRRGIGLYTPPPPLREDELSPEERDELHAARWMFEYNYYRQVSNFPHHLIRTAVEQNPQTVACRKLFYKAEKLNLEARPDRALEEYLKPVEVPAWAGRKLNPLDAWRELVLMKNKEFREDSFAQEQTAEYQVRFQLLYNRREGKDLKENLGRAATLVPLLPKLTAETFRGPVFLGPFEIMVKEDTGEEVPLLPDRVIDTILDRMRLPTRRSRRAPPTAPPTSGGRPAPPPTPTAVTPP
jgi:hypothetical protein